MMRMKERKKVEINWRQRFPKGQEIEISEKEPSYIKEARKAKCTSMETGGCSPKISGQIIW